MIDQIGADGETMIDKAQGIRLGLMNNMTMNGNMLPTDPDTVNLLLKVLSDSDRSEISRLKIKADQKSGEEDRKTALLLAEASMRRMELMGSGNIFEVSPEKAINNNIPEPNLAELPPVTLTPGLMDRGHNIESYDDFIRRTSAKEEG